MRILTFLFGLGVLTFLTWLVVLSTYSLAKKIGLLKGGDK